MTNCRTKVAGRRQDGFVAGLDAGLVLGLVFAAVGCAGAKGSGVVQGLVNVTECWFEEGVPKPIVNIAGDTEPDYDMRSEFVVGQPFDSTSTRFPANQMMIRVQQSAARLEDADALVFWILDSYEVVRCLRGRMNDDGTPDWDSTICDGTPDAPGRLHVGMTYEKVSSFFVLNKSCPSAFVSASALGLCDDGTCPDVALCPGRGSWITFSNFGTVPATGPVGRGYKVAAGEQVRASAFHVELCDSATVDGVLDNVLPILEPNIIATLDGFFDFDL